MTLKCQEIGGYNLSQGVCDLPTPKQVLSGAAEAVKADRSVYAPAMGIDELREKIHAKVRSENGIQCEKNQVMVASGVTGAFASILTGLCDPGDGVVLLEPFYGYHYSQCVLTLCEPQVAELDENFEIDIERIKAVINEKTRAIVLNTPSNPSGRMFSKIEIESVIQLAKEKKLFVIADEIYEYFRYDDREHISPASLDDTGNHVITMMGFSKSFSVTGWRLAYVVAPEWAVASIAKANDLLYVCAPTPLQYGAIESFAVEKAYYQELIQQFTEKRNLFCDTLEKVGLKPVVPEGSYYILADVSGLEKGDSIAATDFILNEGKVASVPGQAFFTGPRKDQYVRFCFAVEDEILQGACAALEKLK